MTVCVARLLPFLMAGLATEMLARSRKGGHGDESAGRSDSRSEIQHCSSTHSAREELFDEQGRHGAPMADWSARADDPSFQTDLRVALTSAIGELPADYRTVLVLRDVEGLSTLEVADALSIGVSSVKSRVHRARLFLRKRLGDALTTRDGDEACAVGATHGACRTRSHSRREHARRRGIDGR